MLHSTLNRHSACSQHTTVVPRNHGPSSRRHHTTNDTPSASSGILGATCRRRLGREWGHGRLVVALRRWGSRMSTQLAGATTCASATTLAVPAKASAWVPSSRTSRLRVWSTLTDRALGDRGTVWHAWWSRWWWTGRRRRCWLVWTVGMLAPVHNPRLRSIGWVRGLQSYTAGSTDRRAAV